MWVIMGEGNDAELAGNFFSSAVAALLTFATS
jgi:hypothetical protein